MLKKDECKQTGLKICDSQVYRTLDGMHEHVQKKVYRYLKTWAKCMLLVVDMV